MLRARVFSSGVLVTESTVGKVDCFPHIKLSATDRKPLPWSCLYQVPFYGGYEKPCIVIGDIS